MVFSSNIFLYLFLPLTLLLYWVTPRRGKNVILLLASLFFYAWGESTYVLVMLTSIVGNYLLALGTARSDEAVPRRRWFLFSLLLNIGLLAFFKYAGFFLENLAHLIAVPKALLANDIHLPLGISFFTFQSISYQYDLYKKRIEPERNFVDLGLYIAMFPQLIAGPIVRYVDIHLQIKKRHFRLAQFQTGIQRFIVGLAKKVLIANTFGEIVESIRGLPEGELSNSLAILLIVSYAIQIFFDFSGYSDMAIGLGKLFGFDLLENFNYPYISRSIRDFWRRWHISLSTWFRDYLYIPLGGNRKVGGRTYLNLVIVFFLTGLWHGASWNFILWGLYHGFFLIAERFFKLEFLGWLGHVYALVVVLLGWVLFMTNSLAETGAILSALFDWQQVSNPVYPLAMFLDREHVVLGMVAILLSMPVVPYLTKQLRRMYRRLPVPVVKHGLRFLVWAMYMSLMLLSMMYISAEVFNPFIYFRF